MFRESTQAHTRVDDFEQGTWYQNTEDGTLYIVPPAGSVYRIYGFDTPTRLALSVVGKRPLRDFELAGMDLVPVPLSQHGFTREQGYVVIENGYSGT